MMSEPAERYLALLAEIERKAASCGRDKGEMTLVVVTKTRSVESIRQLYQAGCRNFGENRLQESIEKISALPQNICWHLIGTLQSNKINKAIQLFDRIHSVDSFELAQKISLAGQKQKAKIPLLLQVNMSGERSKHGLSAQEWDHYLNEVEALPNIQLEGLMTIAPFEADDKQIRGCFSQLRQLRDKFRDKLTHPQFFTHLSMGMSNDYLIAIEEGATLLRIGSAIFGPHLTQKKD